MIQVTNFKITTGSGALSVQEGEPEYKSILPMNSFTAKTSEKVLSVSQFASEARVSTQAVRKMIADERLHARKLGKQYTIPVEELHRYLKTLKTT